MASPKTRQIINIRYKSNNPVAVEVDPSWDVARLKREVGQRLHIPAREVRIIFQGRELSDMVPLKHCDLGDGSILNAIKGGGKAITLDADRQAPLESLVEMEEREEPEPETSTPVVQAQFYVYCKRPCNDLQPGKIRVWCKKCQHGAFEVERDPECFDDVMEPNKIRGQCNNSNCDGTIAEFYFKCKTHQAGEFDTASPMTLVRSNMYEVPCAACFESENPVLVFPCEDQHVMCVPCFKDYCQVKLNERGFVQDSEAGYTVPCPGTEEGCTKAFVKEGHHFRLLGGEQYDRYQTFGTEEFILQNGGVLCPKAGCGAGILPNDPSERKVKCEKHGAIGCGFVFCRQCKESYHQGLCGTAPKAQSSHRDSNRDRYQLNRERAQRARWDREATQEKIREISKNCPKCNVATEKNGGCMHMTCTRCKFGWCWMCKVKWNGQCQGNHWFGE